MRCLKAVFSSFNTEMAAPGGYNPDSMLSGGDNVTIQPVQGGGGAAPGGYIPDSTLSGGDDVAIQPVQGGGNPARIGPLEEYNDAQDLKLQNAYFELYKMSTYGPDLVAHATIDYDTYQEYVITRSAELFKLYKDVSSKTPSIKIISPSIRSVVVVPPITTASTLLGLVKDLSELNILTSGNTIQEGFMILFMGIDEIALRENLVILDCLQDSEKCMIIKEYCVYPHEHKNNRGIIISSKEDPNIPSGFTSNNYNAIQPRGPVPDGYVHISLGTDIQVLQLKVNDYPSYINTLRAERHKNIQIKENFLVARLHRDTNIALYSVREKSLEIDAFTAEVDDVDVPTIESGIPGIKDTFQIRKCYGFNCAVDTTEDGIKNKSLLEDWYHGRFTMDEANLLNTLGIRPSYCNDMFTSHGGCSFVIANILRYASLTECFHVDKIDLMTQRECDLVRSYLNVVQAYARNLNLNDRDREERAKGVTLHTPLQKLPADFRILSPNEFAILASQEDGIQNLEFMDDRDIRIKDYDLVIVSQKNATAKLGQHVYYALAPKGKPLPKHHTYTFIKIPYFKGASAAAPIAPAAPAAPMAPMAPIAAPMAPIAAPMAPVARKITPRVVSRSASPVQKFARPKALKTTPRVAPMGPRVAPMGPKVAPLGPKVAPMGPRVAPMGTKAPKVPKAAKAPVAPKVRKAPVAPMAPMAPMAAPLAAPVAPMDATSRSTGSLRSTASSPSTNPKKKKKKGKKKSKSTPSLRPK